MAGVKHAVYCGTRNIYGDMEMAAKSLIANSDVDKVHFIIEDAKFPTELPDIIECHDVSGQTFFPPNGANSNCAWSYMTLMRAAVALMPEFSHIDRMLSLDCDTVCVRDVSPIWGTPLDGCYFAAVPESWLRRDGVAYCNIGVTLFNLAQLRDGKAGEVVDVLNRHRFGWPDQDALNYLCQGRIALLSAEYNWCPWVAKDGTEKVRVVHYAARNDWRNEPPAVKYRKMTWEQALNLHESFCC